MIDYKAILEKTPNGVLATTDGENIFTRVFQYLYCENGNVYFCTSSKKDVYAQLTENPAVSFCTYTEDFSPVLSVNGKAVFFEDIKAKKYALDANPHIKAIYGDETNPEFKMFYIKPKTIETFSFSEGPKKYEL